MALMSKLIIVCALLAHAFATQGPNGMGGNPYVQDREKHLQQPYAQQYLQQQPHPPGSRYNQGSYPQPGGFLNRLKNFAANTFANINEPAGSQSYESQFQQPTAQNAYGSDAYRAGYPTQQPNTGVLGKIKSLFGATDDQNKFANQFEYQQYQQQQSYNYQQQFPGSTQRQQQVDPYTAQQFSQSQSPQQSYQQHQQQFKQTNAYNQQQPPPPPPPQQPQAFSQVQYNQPFPPQQQQQQQVTPVEEDPLDAISSEPQIFIHKDSIVMILKPKEFYRKKYLMMQAGPNQIQLFSDFEHVMTKFNNDDGSRAMASNELLDISGAITPQALQKIQALNEESAAITTEITDANFEDLTLKTHSIIANEGGLHITSVAPVVKELYNRLGLREGWNEALQSLSSRNIPTYLFSSGYGDVIAQTLMQSKVTSATPMSAYDIIQSNVGGMGTVSTSLPQNIRIISNFFRAAPDGTVRAFTQPAVHERNKNATTASRYMGMQIPSRPYAIVLGSHEDDISMTDGVPGLKEQLSIGYLETTEDITKSLPIYLNAFDAIIIGDGNFQFIKTTIDDILQLSQSSSTLSANSISANINRLAQGATSRFGVNIRKGLGMFLNNNNNNNNGNVQQQQPPQQYPPQYQQPQHQQQQPQPQQPFGNYQQYPQEGVNSNNNNNNNANQNTNIGRYQQSQPQQQHQQLHHQQQHQASYYNGNNNIPPTGTGTGVAGGNPNDPNYFPQN